MFLKALRSRRALTLRHSLRELAPLAPIEVVSPTELRTARMTLRPLRPADRGEYLRVVRASRAHLTAWIPLNDPGESDDAFFDRQLAAALDGDKTGACWRRVGVLDDASIVGAFHLNAISRGLNWWADATWWIAAAWTRHGLATEGVGAMLGYAMSDPPRGLGLRCIHAGVDPRNAPSRRLVEKLGFTHDPSQASHLKVGDAWRHHEFYVKSAA
ncbi:MAG: GNAT family protein [Phycisphaerales bacterium]